MTLIKKKQLLFIMLQMFLLSCNGQRYVTLNNLVKIPNKSSMYNNIYKFDDKLLKFIDVDIVYEEFDLTENMPKSLDFKDVRNLFEVIRFYSNGYLSEFAFKKEDTFNGNSFNPSVKGIRGLYYWEKNKIKYDIFVRTNGMGYMGKVSGEFVIKGDTLIDYPDNKNQGPYYYIKRKIPIVYLDYQVDWKSDLEKHGK